MTICLMIRHAAYDFGKHHLAGRAECSLSLAGQAQAKMLVQRVPQGKITLIESSPQRRCLETIAPLSVAIGRPVSVCPALNEIDFGAWTGLPYALLDSDPEWRQWTLRRGTVRPPGGETMAEAQARIVGHLAGLPAVHAGGTIVVMTHAELIRAVVLHCMSLPLDAWASVDVPFASVTTVAIGRSGQMFVDQKVAA